MNTFFTCHKLLLHISNPTYSNIATVQFFFFRTSRAYARILLFSLYLCVHCVGIHLNKLQKLTYAAVKWVIRLTLLLRAVKVCIWLETTLWLRLVLQDTGWNRRWIISSYWEALSVRGWTNWRRVKLRRMNMKCSVFEAYYVSHNCLSINKKWYYIFIFYGIIKVHLISAKVW